MPNLDAAWRRLFAGSTPKTRRGFGIDGESIDDIKRAPAQVLASLSTQLVSRGGYRFCGLRPFIVEKKNGKKRVICVPTVRDRLAQRAILQFLSKDDKCRLVNNVSFGFIPGKGVRLAAERACALRATYRFAYKTDISAFFDTLERVKLAREVRAVVRHRSLWPILERVISCEIEESRTSVLREIARQGIRTGSGVRQGMPLSPLFANIYLRAFDKAVERRGYHLVRYADDLIFLANSEAECIDIHGFVVVELASLGLTVPAIGAGSKTQIFPPNHSAEFLGVDLAPMNTSYVLRVAQPQIKNACDKLINACDPAVVRQNNRTLAEVQQNLSAIQAGYLEAYRFTNNKIELERFLDSTRRKAISKLVLTITGLDLQKLDEEKRRFLGA
jgi:RNA-directed DNA polymerase